VAGGVALGAATLSRTMVLGLAPAVAVGVMAMALTDRERRRHRCTSLALAGMAALAVMAPWWVPNATSVLDYLGQPARVGGLHRGQQGGGAWRTPGIRDLRLLASDLLLPTLAVLVLGLFTGFVLWWRRGRPVAAHPRLVVVVSVVLLSTGALMVAGEAVGQWLPVLPAMIVVGASGIARLPRSRQTAGAVVIAAAALFNVAQSSRVVPELSRPRMIEMGPLGRLPLTDARWLLEDQVRPGRLVRGGVLPEAFSHLQPQIDDLVRRAANRAASAGEPGVLVLPRSAHPFLNANVLMLTDRLVHGSPQLIIGGIALPNEVTATSLAPVLADPQRGQPNLVLSVDSHLDGVLVELGFSRLDHVELPGDLEATLWWRARASLDHVRGAS
jgi:hypothetical protein